MSLKTKVLKKQEGNLITLNTIFFYLPVHCIQFIFYRDLAEQAKVGWAEYWPFLNKIVDLKSDLGLDLLEKYLKQRFKTKGEDISGKLFALESTTLLSPMGELCKALETMRIGNIQKEKSPRRSTLVSYTCLTKSCKVCIVY